MNIVILDNIIKDPIKYVDEILEIGFEDIKDVTQVFKGIQLRYKDELQILVESIWTGYGVVYNFVRQSPVNQDEPNFIHSDEMMGDKIILLYLSQEFPDTAGTTIYDENEKENCVLKWKFNRLVSFDAHLKHSRNIRENFGEDNSSRLVQVIFLKKKDE